MQEKLQKMIVMYLKKTLTVWVTVFIRSSAQGAYLIFGLSGYALIRGRRLFRGWALVKFSSFSVSKKFIL